jgi:hypothetical protein
VTAQWRTRVVGGALASVVGYVAAVLLDFEPQPVAYVVMSVVVLTLVWLVLDTVDVPVAGWRTGSAPTQDRVDEATSDLRILTSHQQASVPSGAVRERLVALARVTDPALADDLDHELEPARRLSPGEIDRILTRIEEARDRA